MINVTFSKYVKMNGRLWEVNFRKLPRAENLFYADTATLQGERIIFEMFADNGAWRMKGNSIPEWMMAFEQAIGESIEKGMQEHFPQLASGQLMATA